MDDRRLNNWRQRLHAISLGFLFVAAFAPLSSTLHRILLGVATGGTLVYLATDSPASRKRLLQLSIPLAGFMFLVMLFSLGPHLVFACILGVGAGSIFWDVFKEEHAEYLAQGDRAQGSPKSG
jgi:hypothetical protein